MRKRKRLSRSSHFRQQQQQSQQSHAAEPLEMTTLSPIVSTSDSQSDGEPVDVDQQHIDSIEGAQKQRRGRGRPKKQQ